jgi:hypothetical protein
MSGGIHQTSDTASSLYADRVRKQLATCLSYAGINLTWYLRFSQGMLLWESTYAPWTCRFCRKQAETVQHIICGCKALDDQRYSVFRHPFVEPKDISSASVSNLCPFIRGAGLLNLCWMWCLGLHNKLRCIRGKYADGSYRKGFPTAGPWPQLYRAARGKYFIVEIFWGE